MTGDRWQEVNLISKFQLQSTNGLGVRGDMWYLAPDTWHLICVTWHTGGGEHCVKISGPQLLWFGNEGLFKIFEQKDQLLSDLITKVFVEQPRLHRVCLRPLGKFLASPPENLCYETFFWRSMKENLTLTWTHTLISNGSFLPQKRINPNKWNYCFRRLLGFCRLQNFFLPPFLFWSKIQMLCSGF